MFELREKTLRTQHMLGSGPREMSHTGRSPCLLAFHGFTGTASELMPLLEVVAAAGFAVEAPLLPGHGTHATDLQERTFNDWCFGAREHYARVAVKYDGVVVLGFSMGSLVAMRIASEKPARLAGLVALGNALTLYPYMSGAYAAFDGLHVPIPDAYLVKVSHADALDRVAAEKVVTYDRFPLRAVREVVRGGVFMRGEVSTITCPTFIGHGQRDHVCPPKNATWLKAHIGSTDVTLRTYPRSAHMVAIDYDHAAVASDVTAFLLAQRPVEP
jgi:carboxylesterase